MGKIVRSKIKGMGIKAKISLISLFTLLLTFGLYQGWQLSSYAAITGANAWTSAYASTTYPAGAITPSLTIPAGTDRMLVVAVSAKRTTVGAITISTPTVGAVATTAGPSDFTGTATFAHTAIYYMKEAQLVSAGASTSASSSLALNMTLSGGTGSYTQVYYRVYTGVDQTATPTTASYTKSTITSTSVGPFAPALTIAADDQAIEVVNITRNSTGSSTARTISTWATGWATAGTVNNSTQAAATAATSSLSIRDRTLLTANTGDTSTHTASSSTSFASMVAMSMKMAPTTTTLTVNGNTAIASGTKLDTDAGVLMQRVTVTGSGNLVISSVTVAQPGTATNIASAEVYIDSTSATVLPGTATLIGTATNTNLGGAAGYTFDMSADALTLTARTLTGTTPKYLYIVYDMSSGQATKNISSQITAVGVVSPNVSATGLALSSNTLTLDYSGNVLTASANTADATNAKDSDNAVLMQHFKLDSNAGFDSAITLSSLALSGTGSTATQVSTAKVYISTVGTPATDSTGKLIPPTSAVQIGQINDWTLATPTTIPLSMDYGATADQLVVLSGTSKYIYVVFGMFYPDDAVYALNPTPKVVSTVTAVNAASPDTGAVGLSYATNTITLSRGTWSRITSCGGCHDTSNIVDVGTRNPDPLLGRYPGSHNVHTVGTFTYDCSVCHNKPTIYNHANGFINFSGLLDGGKYSRAPQDKVAVSNTSPPAGGYGTCNGTSCHGTQSPVWGTSAAVGTDECTKCHGTNSTTGNEIFRAPTSPAAAAHAIHLSPNISNAVACSDCHQSVTAITSSGHMDGVVTLEYKGIAVAGSTTPTGVYPASCGTVWCHGGNTTTLPLNRNGSQTGIPRAAPVWGTTFGTANSTIGDALGASSTNTGSGQCAKCHGFPPATSSHVGATLSGATNGCYTCHKHVSTTGQAFVDKSLHINGIVEGGSCISCHNSVKGGVREDVANHFTYQSKHVQGRDVTTTDCAACHMEANTDGSENTTYHKQQAGGAVNLVVWQASGMTGSSIANRATQSTFVSYTANGRRSSIQKINNVCLGCHNSNSVGFKPFGTFSTIKYSPEARLATPKAKTSILSRYSSTRTVAWSQSKYSSATGGTSRFGTNNKYSITKALSAHGNAVNNQFPTWDATAGGKGEDGHMADAAASASLSKNRNVFCFDCHNSHGSRAAGITSSYSSANGRNKGGLLKATTSGLGGYAVTYAPAARTINYRNYSTLSTTAATFNSGASICNDCHNNDTRKVNISKPWSITATYSSSKAIVGYWSTPYFDNYTANSAKRTAYKVGGAVGTINDKRKPMGGHFGSSINGTAGSAGYPGSANDGTGSAAHSQHINGLCTPCHDPHGVSNALGSDRDHGVPLLKGSWVTSPYREDKADKRVARGGGSNGAAVANMGAVPGYHIDQNTFMVTPAITNGGAAATTAKSNKRNQRFRSFSPLSSAYRNISSTAALGGKMRPANFAGLCLECHSQTALTGSASTTTSASWLSVNRVHQSVAGWGSSNGTNSGNKVHAYTCAKCHTPHVSRLPRLLVTNCLDVRHFGQRPSGGSISTTVSSTNPGNFASPYSGSALGAGRFPGGGSRYSGAAGTAQNSGGWWFQRNLEANTPEPTTAQYGATCHNAANAGGAAYDPTKQIWNKKSRW